MPCLGLCLAISVERMATPFVAPSGFLLLETADFILLEDGFKLIL